MEDAEEDEDEEEAVEEAIEEEIMQFLNRKKVKTNEKKEAVIY